MRDTSLLLACLAVSAIAAGAPANDAERAEAPAEGGGGVGGAQAEFFERRIRPLLAANCYSCHGPDVQESSLRLDSRTSILKGGEGGKVVVPGKPRESRLIQAVRRQGELEMPPTGPLEPDQIAALEAWISMGLPWPRDDSPGGSAEENRNHHWAFQPVGKPEVPAVKQTDWPRTPLDCFILARLEAEGLQPAPPADRRTLIRRAFFDLLGLPPTPDEVEAFVADPSPTAYEELIDRLLASPRYGERWGRYWLDVARYADNKGYVFFEEKNFPWAYTYRDYVVRSFNEDLPYDRFVLEQLAADQLDLGADRSALAAMGFLTLGGRFMNNVHDILDDRIDVVTRGLMGLTVSCARCHDHKYDPIPQTDYYALYGVFAGSVEPTLPPTFLPQDSTEESRKFAEEMNSRIEKLRRFVDGEYAKIVEGGRTRIAEYLMAAYAQSSQPSTEDFMLLVDTGDLNPAMLLRWEIYLKQARESEHPVWTIWHAFANLDEDRFAEQAPACAARLAELAKAGAALNPHVLSEFAGEPPASMQEVADRYARLLHDVDEKWQAAREQAIGAGNPAPEQLPDSSEEELRQVLYGSEAPASMPRATGWGFLSLLPDRPTQEEFKKLLKAVEEWSMTGAGAPPRAMVLVDTETPYQPRVFLRGNPNRPGEPVERRFLSVLDRAAQPFAHGSGRLDLARAIVDPQNPLTARVIVNRIWLHHLGRGLVDTPSDFGLRCDPPTHPELLDYLAAQLVEGGWSLKRLHRLIMISAVYRQQSNGSSAGPRVDPENRLLWKMNRRRLDFEAMRDSLLAVSGALDGTMGGPPVDLLSDKFVARRTIYGFVDRMDLPGLFVAFDFPSPATTSPQRDRTTVPPQALFLMNNRFAIEAARQFAERPDIVSIAETEDRIKRMYRVVFGRAPSARELNWSRECLAADRSPDAWAHYAQALLMTNQFLFVD